MRNPTAWLLTIAALCGAGAVGAGDIYCNNQGHDCSDRPSPGATMVRSTAPSPASSEPAPSATTPTPSAPASDVDARLSQEATQRAVQKDVAATRATQCKAAREKYEKSVESWRIYRLNKDGEREYLTDAEIDQARLAAHSEMDQVCGPTAP